MTGSGDGSSSSSTDVITIQSCASYSLFEPLVRQPRIGHTYHYVHTDRHWAFQPAPVHSSISIHVLKISTQILWLSQWALARLRWHVSAEAVTALPRKAWMWSVQLPASVTRRNRKCGRERPDSGKTERKKVSGIPQNWYKSHFANEISIATRELLQWSHRRQGRKKRLPLRTLPFNFSILKKTYRNACGN